MQQISKGTADKKPYAEPKLTDYGSLARLSQSGNAGGTESTNNQDASHKRNCL